MQLVAASYNAQHPNKRGNPKGCFGGQHPGTMEVNNAYIRTEGLFLRTESGQPGSGQESQNKPKEGGFQTGHAGYCTRL
jgi:hypothetical protein